MDKPDYLKKISSAAAVGGAVHERTEKFRNQVGVTTDRFKVEAAEKVESLAEQLRHLGRQFERPDEAHALARRLERTADYLRYRNTTAVAEDAWEMARRTKLFWIAGGMLAGTIIYRIAKNQLRNGQ